MQGHERTLCLQRAGATPWSNAGPRAPGGIRPRRTPVRPRLTQPPSPVLCPLLSFVLLNIFLACDSSSWAQKEGRTEAWALQRFWDIAGGLSGRANTLSRCSFDSFQVFVYKRLEGLNRSWDSNRMSGNGYSGFRVTEVCAQLLMTHMNLKAQSYLTLCDPIDCSPPGSSVHGILQARMLEWVAISFFRGSSQPRD